VVTNPDNGPSLPNFSGLHHGTAVAEALGMKTAAAIVATIMLLGTAAMGFMASNRSVRDADTIDKAQRALASAATGTPSRSRRQLQAVSADRLRAGSVAFALVALMSLATLIVVLLDNGSAPHLALATIAVAILAVILNPSYDLGPGAPASARTLAYVVGVLASVGAAAAFDSHRRRRRRAGHQTL